MRYHPDPIRPISLEIGDYVRLGRDARPRHRWTVRAVSEHYAALVRQAPFEPLGVLEYTVLDWRSGVRGPCDLIGQGWGDGTYSTAECAAMLDGFEFDEEQDPARLAALAAGETSWVPTGYRTRVSQRNWLPLDVVDVNGEPVVLEHA